MGDYAKAEPLYQQALRLREKVFGPDHLLTSATVSNLGVLYWETGKYAQAQPLLQRVLQLRIKKLGLEDPDTMSSQYNLGILYDDMGDYPKARPLLEQCLTLITSANFTDAAQSRNVEVGLCLKQAEMIDRLVAYFEALIAHKFLVKMLAC
jgi:tetratricopeptide (TPR) repeat protein